MKPAREASATIDEYIADFPVEIQAALERLRLTIATAAPDATEKISYQMPTFYFNGNLVHFAAFNRHDPCVLYTLLAARHYLDNGESIPWWKFTAQGKKMLTAHPKHERK